LLALILGSITGVLACRYPAISRVM